MFPRSTFSIARRVCATVVISSLAGASVNAGSRPASLLDRRNLAVVAGPILTGSAELPLAMEPGAGRPDALRLDVRVRDLAGLTGDSLRRAELAATYVLSGVGIDAVWVLCTPDHEEPRCADPGAPTHVFVSIVAKPTEGAFRSRPRALAIAAVAEGAQGSRVYIVYERVEALARESPEVHASVLLGYVIAHEIGHLLLGSHSHSATGIMQARWFQRELHQMATGDLLFTPSEHIRLHAALLARNQQDGAR